MKPTPSQLELIFLHDLDRRLVGVERDMRDGRPVKSWTVGGIRNALNSRIAEVQAQRDNELKGESNAEIPQQAKADNG